jgi:hypothetical protein
MHDASIVSVCRDWKPPGTRIRRLFTIAATKSSRIWHAGRQSAFQSWRRSWPAPCLGTGVVEAQWRRSHTTSAIEQPVSSLDRIVDSVRACRVVNLPQTKADLGHLVAIVQRNVGRVDSHCCEKVAIRERSSERSACSGYASANGREERASGNCDGAERSQSINTCTAKTPGYHILKVLQVTIKFPGLCRLYTPPRRLAWV